MNLQTNLFGGVLQYTRTPVVFDITDIVSPQDAGPVLSKGRAMFYWIARIEARRFARMYAALSGKSQLIRMYRNEEDYEAGKLWEQFVVQATPVVKVSFFMKRIK